MLFITYVAEQYIKAIKCEQDDVQSVGYSIKDRNLYVRVNSNGFVANIALDEPVETASDIDRDWLEPLLVAALNKHIHNLKFAAPKLISSIKRDIGKLQEFSKALADRYAKRLEAESPLPIEEAKAIQKEVFTHTLAFKYALQAVEDTAMSGKGASLDELLNE